RERGRPAARLHGGRRGGREVRQGAPDPRRHAAEGHRREEPPDRGEPALGGRGSAQALCGAEERARGPPLRLLAAPERLRRAAGAYSRAHVGVLAAGAARPSKGTLARWNAAVRQFEAALTDAEGLPGRPWYRNFVYAPGAYTGYAVKTLPAVREAIEQKRWDD